MISDSLLVSDTYQKTITVPDPPIITYEVTLSDNLTANDDVSWYVLPVTDLEFLDTLSVNDLITVNSIKLNQSTLSDSVLLTDNYRKTIERNTQTVIEFKTLLDSLAVTDNVEIGVFGIKVRTLQDSLSLVDREEIDTAKQYFDSLAIGTDSSAEERVRNRIVADNISITDDIIVSRSSITTSLTKADSISTFDQALPTKVEYIVKSAKIKHGIEIA